MSGFVVSGSSSDGSSPVHSESGCPSSRCASSRSVSSSLLPLRAIARLRLLADALEPPVDVLAVGDDELEAERLEVGGGIGLVGEAVEHGEERIGLTKLAGNLRAPGHVDDSDRGRRRLLRADDLREPVESVVRDHRHPEIRLSGRRPHRP